MQPLSYFFCQAGQSQLSNAISVLRGLVWFICKKQPAVTPFVREADDIEDEKCFEDLFSLRAILENILQKPCMQTAILMVDALDECSGKRDGIF